jgi:hypothetical protein
LGGCGLKCEARLVCGHSCPLTCHGTSHAKVVCQKLCLKKYDDCVHQCHKKCHIETECLPCNETIQLKMPHCDHISDLPCFMRKTNQFDCGVPVSYTCPMGHQVLVRCCDLRNKELQDRLCNHPCNTTLVRLCISCLVCKRFIFCYRNVDISVRARAPLVSRDDFIIPVENKSLLFTYVVIVVNSSAMNSDHVVLNHL